MRVALYFVTIGMGWWSVFVLCSVILGNWGRLVVCFG